MFLSIGGVEMVFELTGTTIVVSAATLYSLYQAICWILDRYHIGEKRKEYYLMKEANKNMMRELIRTAHKDAITARVIDEDELEHIESVYETYHALGGNGTGDRWMRELRSLARK